MTQLHKFDVICTDAFLTRFNPNDGERVLRTWADLLRPHGRILTTIRVAPSDRTPSAQEPRQFAKRAAQAWADRGYESVVPCAEIEARALEYAHRMTSQPLGTKRQIVETLMRWTDVEDVEVCQVEGELAPTEYLHVTMKGGRLK